MVELHQDHIHLSRLLKMLDRHVHVLQSDGDPDFIMMMDIVEYIRNYSDFHHHPKEDHVYKVFKDNYNQAIHIVDGLLDEHIKIPKVTIAFQQLLDGALNGSIIISRDELSERITNFIDIQRNHLNIEEEKLFPLIHATLKESDWIEIEALVQEKQDPLFGTTIEEGFEILHETMEND
jgi:hemerythrin-like domain-containing protein